MTVSTTTARNVRDGNGVATSFVYDFVVLSSSHLKVYELVGTVLTLRTEGVHYSVTGVGNAGGGTVVFNTAPASVTPGTGNVVLQRAVPMTQAVHYVANDAFPESTHEAALDKLTMLVQQVSDAQSLGLQMPLNYTGSSEDVVADLLASSQTASAAADDAAASASAASISASDAAAAVGGVKVTTSDTTPEPLNSKLTAGPGVSFMVLNPSGDESLSVASVGATIMLASKLGAL